MIRNTPSSIRWSVEVVEPRAISSPLTLPTSGSAPGLTQTWVQIPVLRTSVPDVRDFQLGVD